MLIFKQKMPYKLHEISKHNTYYLEYTGKIIMVNYQKKTAIP